MIVNDVIIGAGFGDEGKGQTVSNILGAKSSHVPFIVRFNGGHQAGHTVKYDGIRHIFSNFGSGTLQDIPTYWSRFCTVHPKGIMNEFNILQNKGITPKLWIDPLCLITLPHDIVSNRQNNFHGTVGVGFGETVKRHENFYKIFAADLLNKSVLLTKLDLINNNYYYPNFDIIININEFLNEVEWLLDNPNIIIKRPMNIAGSIFEGAQGILLDQDFGFFPHVTRSKTTTYNVNTLINELNIGGLFNINYVTRSYHTRHGDGPFDMNNTHLLNLKDNILETNIAHKFQGEFKRTILDIDLLKYAIKLAECERQFLAKMKIIVTCLDHHQKDNFFVKQNGNLKIKFADSFEKELNDFLG